MNPAEYRHKLTCTPRPSSRVTRTDSPVARRTARNFHPRHEAPAAVAVPSVGALRPPATLKNALDYLSREWAWKPIGVVSYGNTSAGTRSVQHAKQVVTTLRLGP